MLRLEGPQSWGCSWGVGHPDGNASRWQGQAGVGEEECSQGGAQQSGLSVAVRGKIPRTPKQKGQQLGRTVAPVFRSCPWEHRHRDGSGCQRCVL